MKTSPVSRDGYDVRAVSLSREKKKKNVAAVPAARLRHVHRRLWHHMHSHPGPTPRGWRTSHPVFFFALWLFSLSPRRPSRFWLPGRHTRRFFITIILGYGYRRPLTLPTVYPASAGRRVWHWLRRAMKKKKTYGVKVNKVSKKQCGAIYGEYFFFFFVFVFWGLAFAMG